MSILGKDPALPVDGVATEVMLVVKPVADLMLELESAVWKPALMTGLSGLR